MIEQIKESLDKATQGPWVIGDIPQGDQYLKSVTNKVGIVGGCLLTEDANLIANSPEWLRYLIGEVERLEKVVHLRWEEWSEVDNYAKRLEEQNEELKRELAEYREEEEPGPRFKMDAQGNLTLVEGE